MHNCAQHVCTHTPFIYRMQLRNLPLLTLCVARNALPASSCLSLLFAHRSSTLHACMRRLHPPMHTLRRSSHALSKHALNPVRKAKPEAPPQVPHTAPHKHTPAAERFLRASWVAHMRSGCTIFTIAPLLYVCSLQRPKPARAVKGARAQRGAHRELAVLERLGGRCGSPATALLLGDALAALIAGTSGGGAAGGGTSRTGRSKLDEVSGRRHVHALNNMF